MSLNVKRGPCAVCGWDTTNWCSRWENRFYCSPEHLCQDWPKHCLTCKPVGEPHRPQPRTQPSPTDPPSTPIQQYTDPATEVPYSVPGQWQPPPANDEPTSTFSPSLLMVQPNHDLTTHAQIEQVHAQPPLQDPHPISTPTLYLPAAPTTTVNAILFPKHADNPCIILVPCCPPTNPTVSACPEPVIGEYLPMTGGLRPVSGILKHDHENKIERRYPLQVWYCPGADTVNQSILRMGSGQASHAIAGDVLIMKFASKDCSNYIDANFDDLPAVLHLFRCQ